MLKLITDICRFLNDFNNNEIYRIRMFLLTIIYNEYAPNYTNVIVLTLGKYIE